MNASEDITSPPQEERCEEFLLEYKKNGPDCRGARMMAPEKFQQEISKTEWTRREGIEKFVRRNFFDMASRTNGQTAKGLK